MAGITFTKAEQKFIDDHTEKLDMEILGFALGFLTHAHLKTISAALYRAVAVKRAPNVGETALHLVCRIYESNVKAFCIEQNGCVPPWWGSCLSRNTAVQAELCKSFIAEYSKQHNSEN